jgi:glycosyltransferase involved in cell wall biosynthesis
MNHKQTNPLISILIPNFNKDVFLPKTLDSILSQTFKNWECIIVDDGSSDHSLEIIETYLNNDRRFKLYKRPEEFKKGANVCRNYALDKAKGDYLIFFDSDDLFLNDAVEKRLRSIQNTDYDFLIFNGVYWDCKSPEILLISDIQSTAFVADFLNFFPHWLSQSLIINRVFLQKNIILWDETVPYYQDVFFNLELLSKNGKYKIFNEIDWIWRKTELMSLGKSTYRINSYKDNFQFALAYKKSLEMFDINVPIFFYRFCLLRFYKLIQAHQSKAHLSNLIAYIDALNNPKICNRFRYLILKAISKIGIFSYSYDFKIGQSIFFRTWKRFILNKSEKLINNHFLVLKIPMNDKLSAFILKG